MGARFSAMANAGSAMSDIWNVSYNPAGFTAIKSPTVSFGYDNRFVTKELSVKSVVAAFPVQTNYFGCSFSSTGFESYNVMLSSLSYGKKLSERFSAGLKFNYHSLNIESYGLTYTFSVDLGIQAKLTDQLVLATQIVNPTRAKFGNDLINPIETIFCLGALYTFSPKAFITTEVEKSLGFPVNTKVGMEYKPLEMVAVRGGISSFPLRQYFGMGILLKKIKLDVAASTHVSLGYSPQFSLGYEF
ncbi:PorV/PorQ family protein [Solitalea koreensis]|nr:hypothetical protein [Solitalea koreensis]